MLPQFGKPERDYAHGIDRVEGGRYLVQGAFSTAPGGLSQMAPFLHLLSTTRLSDAGSRAGEASKSSFRREHVRSVQQRNARDPQPSRFFQNSYLHPDSQS